MSKQQHTIIFACYACIALITMFALPRLVFGLDHITAILLGTVLLLSGGLLHEIFTRRINETQEIRRLIILRNAYNQNQEDLSRNRDELRRVYEVLEQFNSQNDGKKQPKTFER